MFKKISLLLMVSALLFGFNVSQVQALEKIVSKSTVAKLYKVQNFVRIADNVVILFDTSSSMAAPYQETGMTKLQAAKKLLKQRAASLPDDIPDLNFGLYTFSPPAKFLPNNVTMRGYDVFYKMQPFDKAAFVEAVDKLPEEASGPTLLQNALSRLDDLLAKLSGHTVVFLFTDGSYTEVKPLAGTSMTDTGAGGDLDSQKPVAIAKRLAGKYDVNFQIISVADIAKNIEMMKKVATVNASSRVIPLEELLDRPEIYIGAVFAINEAYIVDAETREQVVGFELDHILFGFDQSDIEMEFTEELNAVGKVLKENPRSYLVLAGFTDNRGSEEYNLALSRKRVEAVGNYLADKFMIEPDRVTLFWYGEAAPVASNDTEEGRRKNRRVLGFIAGMM